MKKNIENLDYSNENSIVKNENIQQKSVPAESLISSKLNKPINLSFRDSVVEKFVQNNNLNDDPKLNSMENNNQIEKNKIEKSKSIIKLKRGKTYFQTIIINKSKKVL